MEDRTLTWYMDRGKMSYEKALTALQLRYGIHQVEELVRAALVQQEGEGDGN